MTIHIKNIKINISVYFAAVITFALLFIPSGNALTTLLCCVLHEIGHLTAIAIFKGNIKSITLGAYGMRIDTIQSYRISPKKEIIISLAGPIVNFALVILGIILKKQSLININLCLGIFNMMPTGTTDGQTALLNTLILHTERQKAEKILKKISGTFLILLYTLGIIILIKSKLNFSLLAMAIYMTVINITKKELIV
ncbi:MAG: hypothetical protein MJ147_02995 [Clostridia bacterium]|nr:hypothetical protein [Clostridia bacterium]